MSQRPRHLTMLYSHLAEPAGGAMWRPATDVYRTKDGWLLKFELAGVVMDDVSVTARGAALTVTGVRRDSTAEQGCTQYSLEIQYSRFERTVHLPCDIESGALDIQYVNGILLVRVTI